MSDEELEEMCNELLDNLTDINMIKLAIKVLKSRVEIAERELTYLQEFRRRFPKCNMSDANLTGHFSVKQFYGVNAKWRDIYKQFE